LKREQCRIAKEYPALLRSVVENLSKVRGVPSAQKLLEVGCRPLFAPATTPADVALQNQALTAYYGMLAEVQTTIGGVAERVSHFGGTQDTEEERKAELKVADAVEKYLIVKQVAAKISNLQDAMSVETPTNQACQASAEIIKDHLQPIIDAHDNLQDRYKRIRDEIMVGAEVAEDGGTDPELALMRRAADGVRKALAKCKGDVDMQQLRIAVNEDLNGPEFQRAIMVAMVKMMGARSRDLKQAVASAVEAIGSSTYRTKGDGGQYGNRSSQGRLKVSTANKKAWKGADAARSKYEIAREALAASIENLDDPRLVKAAPTIADLIYNHPDSLAELYDETTACLSRVDSLERVAMREYNKLRSMQVGSRTLCESHINQAHAYARLAENNIALAKLALQGEGASTQGDDGIHRGPSERAFEELYIAMRGKPTDGVPKVLAASALQGLAAMQFQEAECNLARAHAALACAKPTIDWHYSCVAPPINPACIADPSDHRDARQDILRVLELVTAEVTELMAVLPFSAENAVACADLTGAGTLAAGLVQAPEGMDVDDDASDGDAVGVVVDNSASGGVIGADDVAGGGAVDGENGGSTVECTISKPTRDLAKKIMTAIEEVQVSCSDTHVREAVGTDEERKDEAWVERYLAALDFLSDENELMWVDHEATIYII
jgi:hypothetical protein